MTSKLHTIPTIRVEPALWDAIQVVVAEEFSKTPDAVRMLIALGIEARNGGKVAPAVKSESQELAEQKKRLENQVLENKIAKDRREWIPLVTVRDVLRKRWGLIRSAFAQIAHGTPGLTDAQRADVQKQIDHAFDGMRGDDDEL